MVSHDKPDPAGSVARAPRTMFDKIWDRHIVLPRESGPSLIYIDRLILHEGSFHAFEALRQRGLQARRPQQVFGVADHYVPTSGRRIEDAPTPAIRSMIRQFDENMRTNHIRAFSLADPGQGIVHVVGPEQGLTQPGMVIVCGDSHTSTHGALGAIAFGIGQSENTHVLATQTLWQVRPKTLRIRVDGRLASGVTAKDVILAIIGQIGAGGAVGHAIEYAGSVIASMSVEQRLTVCNMSIEAGARCGMIAPDDATFTYLHNRPMAPRGAAWDRALAYWRTLPTDGDAHFDRDVQVDGSAIEPMVTWGTSPEDVLPVGGAVPDPAREADLARREAVARSLDYMGLLPGARLAGTPVDYVFIGSCTNARLEDLRQAASVVKGRKAQARTFVVPGSTTVKREAEAEGLDRIFRDAGFAWLESGCSMCVGINGDIVPPGARCASTSNRNFRGRQGPNARTHLMSPVMAAAAAVTGCITDVRRLSPVT